MTVMKIMLLGKGRGSFCRIGYKFCEVRNFEVGEVVVRGM